MPYSKVARNGQNSTETDFRGPEYPQEMNICTIYVGYLFKPCWTIKISLGWKGGSGKVEIWPRMGLAYVHFWLRSPLETPKWVKDPRNGLKSIRGSWGDHLRSISGVFDPFRGL